MRAVVMRVAAVVPARMNRRAFVSGVATATAVGVAGCLGDAEESRTDDEHLARLRAEIDDRGVDHESIDVADDVVTVEHGHDGAPNDAVANVAMAFVERIEDGWGVTRLEGLLHGDGADWTWHAKAEWAREYAEGEISPEEYGSRLSETMSRVLEIEGTESGDGA
jgi:hypothetical protein